MTRFNAEPEERDLFDLPLAPPSERRSEVPRPTHEPESEGEPDTLDLFPREEETPGRDPREREESGLAGPVSGTPRTSLLIDRVLASLIDLGAALGALAIAWIGALLMGIQAGLGTWPAFAALGLVFSFLYQTIPLAFWGSTPGMGRRRLETRAADGGRITFRQAALRWAGWLASLALLGTPYVLALSGRDLADRLSGSRTVAVR